MKSPHPVPSREKLKADLVLALQDEDVGNPAERDSEVNDLGLGDLGRNVPDVNDPRRGRDGPLLVQLHPLGLVVVVAGGGRRETVHAVHVHGAAEVGTVCRLVIHRA